MSLKSFFAKLFGKTDDVAKLATTYGDDVAGCVANNAGRAVMSPELLSDDFLDAVDNFAYHAPVSDTASHILGSVPPETALNYKSPKLDWDWGDLDPTSHGQPPMITPGSNHSYKIRDLDVNYGIRPEDAIVRNSPIEGIPVKKYGTLFSDGHYQVVPTTVPPIVSGRRNVPVKSGSTLREFMENNYPQRYHTLDDDLVSIYGDDIELEDPETINFLGHNDVDQVGFNPHRYLKTIEIPETPINSLVREINYEDGMDFIRPHKNTALGKWFEKKYAASLPPRPKPRFVEIDEDDLPF